MDIIKINIYVQFTVHTYICNICHFVETQTSNYVSLEKLKKPQLFSKFTILLSYHTSTTSKAHISKWIGTYIVTFLVLNPNWHERGHFPPPVFFGVDFVS